MSSVFPDVDAASAVTTDSRAVGSFGFVHSGALTLGGSASQLVLDQGGLSISTRVLDEFPDDEMLASLEAGRPVDT